jgi:5-methylcytosine-specific restriction endonuclease McrA
VKNNKVIVLNKHGEYWSECTVSRAVRKILNNRASVIEEDKTKLLGVVRRGWNENSEFIPVHLPLIIQLVYFDYYRYKSSNIQYSDNGVFIRDKSECQYWHDYTLEKKDGKLVRIPAKRHRHACTNAELTIDHVMPISRGGSTNDFTNAVTACRYCNEIIKRDQTPEEAGMELIRTPKVPHRTKGDIARSFFVFNEKIPSHVAYSNYLKRLENGT